MALKPNQITRRNFVQRAGLLVASLGITGGVQAGLMEKISKKAAKMWGSDALAAGGPATHFCVEILMRAGAMTNALFPSKGQATDTSRNSLLNFYSSPANCLPYTAPGSSMPVYFAKFTAGVGGDLLKTTVAGINTTTERIGVATSQAMNLSDGHTSTFTMRGPNSNAACPAILHANAMAASGMATPVQGIEWNNGVGTTNQRGMYGALAKVTDATTFNGLFKDVPMYFSTSELQLVIGEITNGTSVTNGAVDLLNSGYLQARSLQGATDLQQVSLAGRGQAQVKLLTQITNKFNSHVGDYPTTNGGINQSVASTPLGVALNSALAAFSVGATTSMTISLDFNDWHGDINSLDDPNGKQGQLNQYLGDKIAGFLKGAAVENDPFNTAQKIVDSLTISISSEFTRTPIRSSGDNPDGGLSNFAFISSNVKTGSYGDVTGQGAQKGFDPANPGTLTTSQALGESNTYATAAKILGAPQTAVSSMPFAINKI